MAQVCLISELSNKANKEGKQGTNPEQLFAMGYAACFDSAMNHVAPTLNLKPTNSSTSVAVGIGQKPDGAFGLDLDITITVEGLSEAEAKTLIQKLTKSALTRMPLVVISMYVCTLKWSIALIYNL